ncbi:nucleic acid dioxygenase ALKBH1-like isoform X2 [Dendronephthya gigantea]|uniref:nucleic acid dioxygenase ALKBH1-like isoform X2 n=1 Tax=Dendronephthya gigantea TaxID=151771 RepID=UPI00106AF815|nr:nucleic acid dioxygenase ALKBH1-like isoform X2 [Dendronephthya gigantea]
MAEQLPRFRREFKRYKQRKPPPDFSDVIDFEVEESWKGRKCCCGLQDQEIEKTDIVELGLNDIDAWKCYEIDGYKGFKIIVNAFTPSCQMQWIRKCVENYPEKPNVCNLDANVEIGNKNLWKLYEEYCLLSEDKCNEQRSTISKPLMDQLRWVTLGYHYNWNTKKYSKDHSSTFPYDLGNLAKTISRVLGYSCFTAEAAIINYYHMNSTLSGHTDHSEYDLTAPLFSISFGQSCIFLLGGKTLDDAPCAMFLRSGDVIVMSGDSRLAYHAVPRILRHQDFTSVLTQNNKHETCEEHTLRCLERYLSYSRINVNIRQVEGPGGGFPQTK